MATPQALVYAHALATVAPVLDLSDFYVSAAVATIKAKLRFLDVKDVFHPKNNIFLRTNKTIQELGLDLPGLNWDVLTGEVYTCFHNANRHYLHYVYWKGVNLSSYSMYFVDPEWFNYLSLLDDDEHLVINFFCGHKNDVQGVIKLPSYP